mmetsp:Transcript_10295/g.16538  ORF Transcript_10295/g.16538 Transcript_10295/m.16538 type:complete len:238 (-) Transcript_10295:61-774(-)|eukprot:jgi/Bigna1/135865/aug1.31_g10573
MFDVPKINHEARNLPMNTTRVSKPELTYFNIEGRGLPIRLAFAIGNIEFKDVRLSREAFADLKKNGKLPLGQLPTLTVCGNVYAQSFAILKYAGVEAGLYPSNVLEAMEVDSAIMTLEDVMFPLSMSIFPERYGLENWKDEKQKMEVRGRLNDIISGKLGKLDAILSKNKSKYAVGSKMTIADIMIYTSLRNFKSGRLDGISSDVSSKCNTLEAIYKTVHEHPKVVDWMKVEAEHKK